MGHKSNQCSRNKKEEVKKTYKKHNRRCEHCKSHTHDTNYCRKKNSVKDVNDRENPDQLCKKENECFHNFAFKANNIRPILDCTSHSLLVRCGAAIHIVTDDSKFLKFDEHFESTKHTIEQADGSKTSGVVLGKGGASAEL